MGKILRAEFQADPAAPVREPCVIRGWEFLPGGVRVSAPLTEDQIREIAPNYDPEAIKRIEKMAYECVRGHHFMKIDPRLTGGHEITMAEVEDCHIINTAAPPQLCRCLGCDTIHDPRVKCPICWPGGR